MRFILLFSLLIGTVATSAQMTVIVQTPTYYTPLLENVFIAGNFNGWNPGDPAYQMTPLGNNTYSITFNGTNGDLLTFKFTRGDWPRVEGTNTGGFFADRQLTYLNNQVVELTIAGWEDFPGVSTATGNLNVLSTVFEIPQLNRSRRIWVYLPPNYNLNNQHYPVIYMLDGQNIFDAASSFAGEWEVDEAMEALAADCPQAIVVGIDNGGVNRINEYSAWVNAQYGGGEAAAFADFMIETLKPVIDANFRTLPARQYTAVMGSSLGGLMATYLALEHGDVYGKAGIFSPSYWFTNGVFELAENHPVWQNSRFFILGGTNESASMVPNMQTMRTTLIDRGYPESEIRLEAHAYGAHNENYWSGEYTEVFKWLFADFNSAITAPETELRLFIGPNPSAGEFTCYAQLQQAGNLRVFDLNGRMVHEVNIRPAGRKPKPEVINLHHLPAATYVVVLTEGANTASQTLVIH